MPALQDTQTELTVAPATVLNVPAMQFRQFWLKDDATKADQVPELHIMQVDAVLAATLDDQDPALQKIHAVADVALLRVDHVPATQEVQLDAPWEDQVPGLQVRQYDGSGAPEAKLE